MILTSTFAKKLTKQTCQSLLNKFPTMSTSFRVFHGKDFNTFVFENEFIIPSMDIQTESYNDFLYLLEDLIRPYGPHKEKEINKTWEQLYKDNNIINIEEERQGDDITQDDIKEFFQWRNKHITFKLAVAQDIEDVNPSIVIWSNSPIAYYKNKKLELQCDPLKELSNISVHNLNGKLVKKSNKHTFLFAIDIDLSKNKISINQI